MKKKKIAVFTGTRAEYGLLFWLLNDIKKDNELDLQLIVSGMHLSPEFGQTYRNIEQDGFVIDEKIEILLSSNSAEGSAKSIGLGVLGFTDALSRLCPDAIVILGDRIEALAAAQTAMILRIPVIHLHGGEITEGAYDDSIRHAITKLSFLHVTSTEEHRKRVIQLGELPERVFNYGAIGLDHIQRSKFMSIKELSNSLNFPINKDFVFVTYHPVTLGDEDPELTFKEILAALDKFSDLQVIISYPNSDDGGRGIIPLIKDYAAIQPNRVFSIPSMGHNNYLSAIKHATAVIGNSSSGIIEAPSLNTPTINIGIRQRGRMTAKSVIHSKPNKKAIASAIKKVLSKRYITPNDIIRNPYGNGNVSKKIVSMIKNTTFTQIKKFYDIKKYEK